MMGTPPAPARLFARSSWTERHRIGEILRRETVGGGLLLLAAVIAMVWANSPWAAGYQTLRDVRFGPAALHLNLTLASWAADGLLAIFFFVAGLELKREIVAGDLRDPARAVVPVAAALGGVALPALVYLLVTWGVAGAAAGWAIPTATDIAFALATLAVVGRHLPTAMRTFLLTLAVVDDLLAIIIIAVGYTDQLFPKHLLAALAALVGFWIVVRYAGRPGRLKHPGRSKHPGRLKRGRLKRPGSFGGPGGGSSRWVPNLNWLLLPLAVVTWAAVHASGVHATVAGVLLAFAVPVADPPERPFGLAQHFEHKLRPISAGLAVPVFALMSAGVPIYGWDGLRQSLADPVALGIVAGLVIGKPLGIMAATLLVAGLTRAKLADDLSWIDVFGIAILSGIGFTVSLLIGELAFGLGTDREDHVTLAVLAASAVAGLLAGVILRLRDRAYRRIQAQEAIGGG